MDRVGNNKKLRDEFWVWANKQRKNPVLAEYKTNDWKGILCHYKLHKNGYLEILTARSDGQMRVFCGIKLIPTKNGIKYKKGPKTDYSVISDLKENILLKINIEVLLWILISYEKIIKPANNFKNPVYYPLLDDTGHSSFNFRFIDTYPITDKSNKSWTTKDPFMKEYIKLFCDKNGNLKPK